MYNIKKQIAINGFSLLELIIILAIIGTLATFSIPAYVSYKNKNNLALAEYTAVDAIRRTQSKAQVSLHNSAWGIRFENNRLTIFKGTDYASRAQEFDETISFSGNTEVLEAKEIIFDKLTAYPLASSSISLSNNIDTKNIGINPKGTVIY